MLRRHPALVAELKACLKDDFAADHRHHRFDVAYIVDRDYMTVPVDEIRDLHSVLTMVDGRIVYEK